MSTRMIQQWICDTCSKKKIAKRERPYPEHWHKKRENGKFKDYCPECWEERIKPYDKNTHLRNELCEYIKSSPNKCYLTYRNDEKCKNCIAFNRPEAPGLCLNPNYYNSH